MTHRGIRIDNVFQSRPGQPVVLGSAWAAPATVGQPALFEPPYSAMCLPAGRGEGSIADDVYSLSVLLLCLGLDHAPLAHLDDAAVVRRKLEVGSYAALLGDQRLPPVIGDLACARQQVPCDGDDIAQRASGFGFGQYYVHCKIRFNRQAASSNWV